jgi:uncharacterized membrane-anchored protein YjiN (DUF445 family)
LAQLLRQIVLDGAHHKLVDLIVAEAYDWLRDNPQVIDEIVHNRAPSWVPDFVNEQLANRLQREVLGWVADVRDNEYHKARQALDAWLVDLSDDLESDSSLSQRAEDHHQRSAQPGRCRRLGARDLGTSLKQLLREAIIDEGGEVRARIWQLIGEFADRLQSDSEFSRRIDDRIATTAGDLAESFGSRDRQRHLRHHRTLGCEGSRRAHRTLRRPRPPVHPHQRHRHRRARRAGDPHRHRAPAGVRT